jgi:hypothetical protein
VESGKLISKVVNYSLSKFLTFTNAYMKAATIGNAVEVSEMIRVCSSKKTKCSEVYFLVSAVTDVPFAMNYCPADINAHPFTSTSQVIAAIIKSGPSQRSYSSNHATEQSLLLTSKAAATIN